MGLAHKTKTVTTFVNKYYELQDKILLVYHPTERSTWMDRCLFLGSKYLPRKAYNHRSILDDEVVIEFDDGTVEENRVHADTVAKRLKLDHFKCAKWRSGNKSTHVHFFIDPREASNVSLLKRVLMRHYSEGLPAPDMKLTSDNHLIRAEYGIHEKTGVRKTPISIDSEYPTLSPIPEHVWDKYLTEQRAYIKRRTKTDVTKLDQHPIVHTLLDAVTYNTEIGDGRERVLFALIHVLKPKFKQQTDGREQLIKYIHEWYRYAGGRQLRKDQIESKVIYHWNRDYTLTENFLYKLCEELDIKVKVPHSNISRGDISGVGGNNGQAE